MSRRNPRTPVLPPRPRPGVKAGAPDPDLAADAELAVWLGERLRRAALGATAALLAARAYWPSEPDFRVDAGGGLLWVFALLVVTGLAVASALVGGALRVRWSWADAAVIALSALVALSAGHAVDRRPAINLGWEWAGFGLAYLLVRSLPRTRGESVALAGALAATAVAVAVYGLYQVGVELPEVQRKFLKNPEEALRIVGIAPGTPAEAQFRDRLLQSNEPYSTFALANSLAGFLVGPLVVMLAVCWNALTRRDGDAPKGSRPAAVALAAPAVLAVLVCLVLTKSRSAYIGLAVGLAVLAWRDRRRVRARTLALAAGAAVLVAVGLAAAGLASGRLDRLVLTESGKSFRYRLEYWTGTWGAISETRRSFWTGYGPGNFLAPYLRHKLPQSSEEIHDPHNFVLEVWAAAGVWAVAALAAAVGLGLWNALRPPRGKLQPTADEPPLPSSTRDPSAPPPRPGWVLGWAAAGLVAVLVVGRVNLFEGDSFVRWLILGASWTLAVASGSWLWTRQPPDPAALGAGALAVVVNLSAAGGIGIPTVALGLWVALALAINLRDDRPGGRLREAGGRLSAYGLAVVWVALVGTFVGTVVPFWKAEAAMAEAEDALRARPPAYDRAEAAYERAKDADKSNPRPWIALAGLEYQVWMSRGASPVDLRWRKIPILMYKAVSPPRPVNSWARHHERALTTSLLIKQVGEKIPPLERLRLQGDVAHASRTAVRLYPTSASLRAGLAEASAEIGMTPDAVKEGREALRLDRLTPHPDKKLDPAVRQWLQGKLPEWEKAAAHAPDLSGAKPQ